MKDKRKKIIAIGAALSVFGIILIVGCIHLGKEKSGVPKIKKEQTETGTEQAGAETEEKNNENTTEREETKGAGEAAATGENMSDAYAGSGRDQKRFTSRYAQGNAPAVGIAKNETFDELRGRFSMIQAYMTEIVSSYAKEQGIACTQITLLDWCYVPEEDAGRKIYVFGQLNDEENTLVTILYQPPEQGRAATIDCLPCQYRLDEILDQTWYGEERQ